MLFNFINISGIDTFLNKGKSKEKKLICSKKLDFLELL